MGFGSIAADADEMHDREETGPGESGRFPFLVVR